MSDDTMMSEPSSPAMPTNGALMSSAGDSHARTFLPLERKSDWPAIGQVFGGKCTESFASYNRDSQSWRTSQRCWIEGMGKFSEAWPRAGLMANGKCYRRVPSVPHTHENACFTFSTLTVVSCEHPGRQRIKSHQQSCLSAELAERDKWRRGGQLNPNHAAWFMGFPAWWTDLEDLEMPSCRKSPNGSAGES
jgi:hypothetical protein